MKLKHFLFSTRSLKKSQYLSSSSSTSSICKYPLFFSTSSSLSPLQSFHGFSSFHPFNPPKNPISPNPFSFPSSRTLHTLQPIESNPTQESEGEEDESDGPMNEFLSRFTFIMRKKLAEAYPDGDKQTIDGMLLVIVDKVVYELEKGDIAAMVSENKDTLSHDFSEDLWKTVWEVSNLVLEDMRKERKKERMKKFLQSENVKEMCRFASEVGIRGDMLREFRFKWAQEEMEMSELYERLDRLRAEDRMLEKEAREREENVGEEGGESLVEEEKVVEEKGYIPQRKGKIRYKIYGLDMSDPKWGGVADRIHEADRLITPEEPKEITGKCKLVMQRILSLDQSDEPSPLLGEWAELLQPGRVDWLTLLDRLRETNVGLYFKVAELVLDEVSFQANIRDYSKLIDGHAKDSRIDDAERILQKMIENGIQPDILTSTILVHMYSKAGNLDRAKEAFVALRSQGFQPDMKAYNSMIMAYVNADQPKLGESLMKEMEARDIKPTKEIYMALLRSFSERGQVDGAHRISNTMQFAGFQPTLESCTLVVEAYSHAGDPDMARNNFDYMIKLGHKPDDRCTASMIAVYANKNQLDKALNLLLQLEKDGFEPGVATYSTLVEWLGELQLVDEAEEIMRKIMEKGDTPLKVHISLCEMYSKSRDQKKALQALGILEGKKNLLGPYEFERIIKGLIKGGLLQDAWRVHDMMETRGFSASESLRNSLMVPRAFHPPHMR